ncbi:SDR family NAD(P)-dependent oxidoreductase [Rhodococcus sp. SGAir0479]|uniref:SDR family NAD(P)-dependent oxidoreductase n=1 Tax=Rhodococcus sp. SGAir0479 TaxID=2567884 RepID=UPI0010CD5D26|nr:SDR family NAD(P)-dependent oxidoreductase [Rhodococcus sp. SGAir0479]QCQ90393.1 SDR family NAD(P)-dependent oxidoreductase [Rhodococcus sp. SGAir0479]
MSARPLTGRTAIVTGAGEGLGRAEALALAAAGANLVLNSRSDRVDDVATEIRGAGGGVVTLRGDIGDRATADRLVALAVSEFGGLDVLVNNAGIIRDRMVFNMSDEEWDSVLRVNLRGTFLTTRAATDHWRRRSKQTGEPVYARVVNTSSEAYASGPPGAANYAASKAGVVALTVSTARGCGSFGVRANAICPRARTEMTRDVFGPAPEAGADPLDADHITPLVVYLASPQADSITGRVLVAYGDRIDVMSAPTVEASLRSASAWTQHELHEVLGGHLTEVVAGREVAG